MKIETPEDIKELKKYSNRRGFVVRFNPPSKKDDCSQICKSLIDAKIIEENPDKVFSYQGLWIFIFQENSKFDAPEFYGKCEHVGTMTQMWQVDDLGRFIDAIPL